MQLRNHFASFCFCCKRGHHGLYKSCSRSRIGTTRHASIAHVGHCCTLQSHRRSLDHYHTTNSRCISKWRGCRILGNQFAALITDGNRLCPSLHRPESYKSSVSGWWRLTLFLYIANYSYRFQHLGFFSFDICCQHQASFRHNSGPIFKRTCAES